MTSSSPFASVDSVEIMFPSNFTLHIWSATADTVDDLLKQVTEHVLDHHKEIEINDDSVDEIKTVIREV